MYVRQVSLKNLVCGVENLKNSGTKITALLKPEFVYWFRKAGYDVYIIMESLSNALLMENL